MLGRINVVHQLIDQLVGLVDQLHRVTAEDGVAADALGLHDHRALLGQHIRALTVTTRQMLRQRRAPDHLLVPAHPPPPEITHPHQQIHHQPQLRHKKNQR